MPKYLDHHAMPQLPPEVVQQVQASMRGGTVDPLGVKGINAFMSTDGQAWCLTEAPNAEAVCKSHEAMGVVLTTGDVHEVQSMV